MTAHIPNIVPREKPWWATPDNEIRAVELQAAWDELQNEIIAQALDNFLPID